MNQPSNTSASNSDPQAGRFYILPKIHKQGNPGRPIISSMDTPPNVFLNSLTSTLNLLYRCSHPTSKIPPISSSSYRT